MGAAEQERTAAWLVATADRPRDNPPHDVRMCADLVELSQWANTRGVRVYLVSAGVDGRHIYAAHCGQQSRVTSGPARRRIWRISGFQT